MSKDKIPALLEAVAALPARQRGLALGLLSTLCATKKYPNAPKVLKDALKVARTPAVEAVNETFNSAKYFVRGAGLYIWPDFTHRILSAYLRPIQKRGIKEVDFIDLPRNMYNREIVTEYLGGMEEARKKAFTPDQLADLIDAQWDGKPGALLSNGYANILYVIGRGRLLFPVKVCWSAVGREWDVSAYTFDSAHWSADSRVLRNRRPD